ncbi:lipopolysaccharide biosynthesis protein [Oribacterium sp. WCC10]|uniref:lipopolysaccharide biosynthesis protein n=1 Tax=Oribacterium sp. WCC10 TaxID=1855343 RepID=UPI0008E007AC|nr:lipopolysaccharide biosynthesis protein [Oribacterium sp. WCC10]SFG40252.1 Membrane protein involved in the export of O-antigen and teichoic acid [Oribacterium sp. WCC10]
MIDNNNLKSKVIRGLFWKILEQCGSQGIQFVVALVLARLMTPEEYGTISLITIFIAIANTFVQSGFATALVQGKEIEEEDYSSVFWMSMLLALICYGVLFGIAPWIAGYYDTPVLRELVRVMGVVLFPGGVVSIQTAYVARNLRFRQLFQSTMIAVIISGAVSIVLAFQGYGVWAMAAQQIVYFFSLMIVMLMTVKWYPHILFRTSRLKQLFSFGWKILASGLIDAVWQNIYGLIIGKKYSSADLGAYNRGEQFPKIIATNLSTAIQSVMLPAYSKEQDDPEVLRRMTSRSIRLSAFVIFPMMAGLAAVARPLVVLLLTDKWIVAAPYLVLLAVSYAVYPIHIINLQVINAMGRSDLFLKLEIIKKALGIVILVLSLSFGIWPMLILKVIDEYICTVINAWPTGNLIGYGPLRQWREVLPSLIISFLMGAVVWSIQYFMLPAIITLLIQMAVGAVVYLVFSCFFNREPLMYIFGLASKRTQM